MLWLQQTRPSLTCRRPQPGHRVRRRRSSPTQTTTGSPTSSSSPAPAPAPRAAPALCHADVAQGEFEGREFRAARDLDCYRQDQGHRRDETRRVRYAHRREQHPGDCSASRRQGQLHAAALAIGQNGIRRIIAERVNAEPSRSALVIETIRGGKTKTELTSSANPARLGQAVTLTASVSGIGAGLARPSGTVTFVDGATILGSIMLEGGRAMITTDRLSGGTHRIKAEYHGRHLQPEQFESSQTGGQAIGGGGRPLLEFKRRFQRVQ